ncbi:MAG: AlwI family type II restriction endonuclease, partial [Ruminococcus bicirculans (ex Wegman et al. 2014)]
RYLRISGMFQRKGRGIMIVPAKHLLAEKLAKETATSEPLIDAYKQLCSGAPLPTDNIDVAKTLLEDLKKQMKERHIVYDISDLPLDTPAEINIARQRLEDTLAKTDEIQYANDQCNQWQEIADYMSLLIKGGGKLVYDEDNAIEIPKDETPAYFEWTLWRAALAIDHMVNKPYEVRGFRLDSDFLPVTAAGGGKGDLYCEFEDFMILTEVTMSTSSRQEAMEGEPVRRHVSDAVLNYNKPVYGLFLAIRIDTNTAETFRHGIWYAKGDVKQRLDIVPLSLEQFRRHFASMFEGKQARPEHLRDLILQCEMERDNLEAPAWMRYIDDVVTQRVSRLVKV